MHIALLGRQPDTRVFLLRDDFTVDAAAPLASPRTCVPGPGTLTLVQTDGQFSTSAGKLVFPAQATPVIGDLGLYGAGLSRVAGRTLIATISKDQTNKGYPWTGWAQSASLHYNQVSGRALYFESDATLRALDSAASIVNVGPYLAATAYTQANVLRSTGNFLFIKGGIYTEWTLLWAEPTGSHATVYPPVSFYDSTGTIDTLRVFDLPAPFDTSTGLATSVNAGSVSAGTTFTHEANCLIEWTETTIPSAGTTDFRFRTQDSSNYWQITIGSTGTITLNEVVAGTPTSRGSAATVVSSGHRVVVVADGTTIKVYSNNTLRITYSSASSFATATSGSLTTLGTSEVVSGIIAWPRTLSNTPKALLDRYAA